MFDEVNVGLMIERQIGETRAVTGYVVRDPSHKTYQEIHQEIRTAQSTPVSDNQMPGWCRSAMLLPWPLSKLFNTLLGMTVHRDPTIHISMAGTAGIPAVGMFGKGHSGWGLETTRHSLDLIVGSTAWKPVVVEGRIEPRQILNLTLVFDHHVIDGAPATRFTRRLLELIESGYGLSELDDRQETITRFTQRPYCCCFRLASFPTPWFILLLWSTGVIAFRLIVIPIEEENLIKVFGDEYKEYKKRTGTILPRLRK